MRYPLLSSVITMLLFSQLALAAETGTALKASEIKSTPFNDAKTVATINKGATVQILGRNSGWMQVQSGKSQGWTRMLNIRRGGAQPNLDLPGTLQVATGRAATGNIASTTGIRGLSEEDLKKAPFDEKQTKRLESYTVSADEAQQFSRTTKRPAQKVDRLPTPSKS